MQQTKCVRLDDEVMKSLAECREGFESPNECLKRILKGQRPCTVADKEEEVQEDSEIGS